MSFKSLGEHYTNQADRLQWSHITKNTHYRINLGKSLKNQKQ